MGEQVFNLVDILVVF